MKRNYTIKLLYGMNRKSNSFIVQKKNMLSFNEYIEQSHEI